MKTELYNKKGEKTKTFDLPQKIFSVDWNSELVYEAVYAHRSNNRQGNAHSKERGDVRGGGKKPWRQKGTGRARHGSIRSPLWRGGGVTFGPRNDRNYNKKINKKAKRKALFSVFSQKLKDEEIRIVDSLTLNDYKTKEAQVLIGNLLEDSSSSILFIPTSDNKKFYNAVKNIKNAQAQSPLSLNVYDLLRFKYIIIDNSALAEIEKHYNISDSSSKESVINKTKVQTSKQ